MSTLGGDGGGAFLPLAGTPKALALANNFLVNGAGGGVGGHT